MTASPYDIHYAESQLTNGTRPPQLFAGDTPAVVTQDLAIAGPLLQFMPLQRDATTGALEPWVNAVDGLQIVAVTSYPIDAETRAAVYTAGMFNLDAIIWPAGTTEAQVEACATGMCKFRKLLWSDKRTGGEGPPGTEATETPPAP